MFNSNIMQTTFIKPFTEVSGIKSSSEARDRELREVLEERDRLLHKLRDAQYREPVEDGRDTMLMQQQLDDRARELEYYKAEVARWEMIELARHCVLLII